MKKIIQSVMMIALQFGSAWASGLEWDPGANFDAARLGPVINTDTSLSPDRAEIKAASENILNLGFSEDSDTESSDNGLTTSDHNGSLDALSSIHDYAPASPSSVLTASRSSSTMDCHKKEMDCTPQLPLDSIFDMHEREMMIITGSSSDGSSHIPMARNKVVAQSPIPASFYEHCYIIYAIHKNQIIFNFGLYHDKLIYSSMGGGMIHEVAALSYVAGERINNFILPNNLFLAPWMPIQEIAARLNHAFLSRKNNALLGSLIPNFPYLSPLFQRM